MEILPSIADWLSWNSKEKEAPGQGIIPTLLSSIDNAKRVVGRNIKDLFTDTDNALTKTADTLEKEILSKEALQDPGQWLSGGGSSAFAGAFRPTASKLLPSVITRIKSRLSADSIRDFTPVPLLNKLSDKEISKYGTPEFMLDKYLVSTQEGGNPSWLGFRELSVSEFIKSKPMMELAEMAESQRNSAEGKKKMTGSFENYQSYVLRSASGKDVPFGIPLEPDIRAFRDQITTKEPLFASDTLNRLISGSSDISTALNRLDSLVKQSKYTPEQLDKKSLAQLLGIAKEVEKEVNKSNEAITNFTKARTQELNEAQGLPPGFVELKTKADFGAETHFMDHCVGAGGVDQSTGKFLPKWNPITGEETIHGNGFENSGEIYYGLAEKGKARYISYRPNGIPEATVEIDKYGDIRQLYGKANSPVPDDLEVMIRKAVKPVQNEMFKESGRSVEFRPE